MSDKDSRPPSDRPAGEPRQSGRVGYDSKGNPVWEWETSTGVFNRDVSTQRLKKLEAKLSLAETQPVPVPKKLRVEEPERLPGGGMNPYDMGGRSATNNPGVHPALAHKQKPASRPEPRQSLVTKYAATRRTAEVKPQGFWEKMKSRLNGGK